ncbi:MAG TPA: hypothetical protein VF610_08845, partial [Segetibacter sp.]
MRLLLHKVEDTFVSVTATNTHKLKHTKPTFLMKHLIIAAFIFCLPVAMHAQLGAFVNRAKSKVQNRINNKADEAVDKTL